MTVSPASESLGTWQVDQDVENGFTVWHVLTFAAGLILALSVCLPGFDTPRGEPVNMMRAELYFWWDNAGIPGDQLFFAFCCFFACHLFGGLMAVASAAHLIGRKRLTRTLSILLAMLLILIGAGLLWTSPISHGAALRIGDYWSLTSTAIAGLAVLTYVIWASRLGSRALSCYEFAACVAAVSYLGFMSFYSAAVYGTYVALAASTLLLVGIVGIARHVSRLSWWETVSQLMTCQLQCANRPTQEYSLPTAGDSEAVWEQDPE